MTHDRTDASHQWAQTLDSLWDGAWARLIRGVRDKRAAARHVTFATLGANGWPQARIVVLRGADKASALLEVHTDRRSAKVAELQADPRASLHVWDPRAHLQIRAEGLVEIVVGDAARGRWDCIPDASRLSYGSTPPPGQPIPTALDYVKKPDPQDFAVLQVQLQAVDLVHLGPAHRRARYARSDGWAGQWLAP